MSLNQKLNAAHQWVTALFECVRESRPMSHLPRRGAL